MTVSQVRIITVNNSMKRIGILTWHYYPNYGSRLQAYALYRYLSICGFEVIFINYRNKIFGRTSIIRRIGLFCIFMIPMDICRYLSNKLIFASRRFDNKYLPQTKEVYSEEELFKIISNYNAIICGSDQIWAPNVYNPIYMLDFVPDNINKVSYAASIGLESIPDEMVENYKKYIGRIDHISVREEKGKEVLKNQCGIESTVVLDPTLLLPKEEWDKLKKKSTIKEKYIFCYFLKKDHQYKELVKDFAKKNDYAIYGVSDNANDSSWMQTFDFRTVGPQEFIGLIESAQCIFTDSYHGTIFSMIYHKPFLLFERFTSNDTICQNSRIEQLRTYFGIEKNIVRADSINTIEIAQVNYDEFESALAKLREGSRSFLKQALN